MSNKADNVVLRHLRELRAKMDDVLKTATESGKRFDEAASRSDETDLRLMKIEGRLADLTGVMHDTRSNVLAVAERLAHIEKELRIAERLTALEAKTGEIASLRHELAELQRRVG